MLSNLTFSPVDNGLIEGLGTFSLLINFLEEFVYNWHYFLLKCLREYTSEADWDGVCFLEHFDYTFSIGTFTYSIFPCVSFISFIFQGNLPISSTVPNCCYPALMVYFTFF